MLKKYFNKLLFLALLSLFFASCSGNNLDDNAREENGASSSLNDIDLCRCLTEPGNSNWSNENRDACRDAISKEIGVENWEKINFSMEPELSRKWDILVEKCTGDKKITTGIDEIDSNNEIIPEIGTSYGYIWESLNREAQIYTTLAFDGLTFRSTAYAMNGKMNSEEFSKMIDISGKWKSVSSSMAEGKINGSDAVVSWIFSKDYTSLTNNKGVVFQRVKVK